MTLWKCERIAAQVHFLFNRNVLLYDRIIVFRRMEKSYFPNFFRFYSHHYLLTHYIISFSDCPDLFSLKYLERRDAISAEFETKYKNTIIVRFFLSLSLCTHSEVKFVLLLLKVLYKVVNFFLLVSHFPLGHSGMHRWRSTSFVFFFFEMTVTRTILFFSFFF